MCAGLVEAPRLRSPHAPGYRSCGAIDFGAAASKCNITCNGNEACDAVTCDRPDCQIACTQFRSCAGPVLCTGDTCAIQCTGPEACLAVTCATPGALGPCRVDCAAFRACEDVTCTASACTVTCNGNEACGGAVVANAKTTNVACTAFRSCKSAACPTGDTCALSCTGTQSCLGGICCKAGVCLGSPNTCP